MRYEEAHMEIVELEYIDTLTISDEGIGDGLGTGEGGSNDDFGLD